MKRLLVSDWACAVCMALCCISNAAAEGRSAKDRFITDYSPAAKKLEAFYGQIRIRAKRVEQGIPDGGEKYEFIDDILYKANGQLLRLDIANRTQKKTMLPDTTLVRVANPKRCFNADKSPQSDNYIIRVLGKDYNKQVESIRQNCVIAWAPYGFLDGTIFECLDSKEAVFEVTGYTRFNKGGEDFAKLECMWIHPPSDDGKQWKIGVWFLFAPEECWVIREYAWGPSKNPSGQRCVLDYGGKIDGVPLLKRAQYLTQYENETKPRRVITFDVSEIVPGFFPEEEFELSSLHIPEIVEKERRRPFWYFLTGTLLIILLAAGLRIIVKRYRPA
jgi:hypothetical protein